jgi:hypothetical protein
MSKHMFNQCSQYGDSPHGQFVCVAKFSLGLFFHLAHYMKCVAEVSLLQNDYWIIQLGSCQLFQQSLI